MLNTISLHAIHFVFQFVFFLISNIQTVFPSQDIRIYSILLIAI